MLRLQITTDDRALYKTLLGMGDARWFDKIARKLINNLPLTPEESMLAGLMAPWLQFATKGETLTIEIDTPDHSTIPIRYEAHLE